MTKAAMARLSPTETRTTPAPTMNIANQNHFTPCTRAVSQA
jgi:hypothetical protein